MTQHGSTTVSVIIPTTLRSSVVRAVRSVRAQSFPCHVVLVVDRPESILPDELADEIAPDDTVLFTGGGRGGSTARDLGTRASSSDVVAYLDDDDYWLPEKIDTQLRRLAGATDLILGCRASYVGGRASEVVPERLIGAGERIEDYLFANRTPRRERNVFFVPTIAMSADLAKAVGWRHDLRRHHDWDFLWRAQQEGARFAQCPDDLVRVSVGSVGSISGSADWAASLEWAAAVRSSWSRRTYADFVAGQPLRYALQARSWTGVRACLGELRRGGALPRRGPAALAAAGLVPRALVDQLLRGRPS